MGRKRKLCAALIIIENEKEKKRCWTKEWLLKRERLSHMHLIDELRTSSVCDLKNYLRMDDDSFKYLLKLVTPYIRKRNTKLRQCISSDERLIATLRYLATGRSLEDLKYSTIISPQALGLIIPETCKYIFQVLKKEYLKVCINYIIYLKN